LGGQPLAPPRFEWPMWNERPLPFLAQLNLTEAKSADSLLPQSGCLYFFFDQEAEDQEEFGAWRVIHHEEAFADMAAVTPPGGLGRKSIFSEVPLAFKNITSYPAWDETCLVSLKLNQAQWNSYAELGGSCYDDKPLHQLGGWAQPVQNSNMEIECQQARALRDETEILQGDELEKAAQEWMLLFQLDTDEAAKMMWGDGGMLYFWIRKEDLRSRNFAEVWMIMQYC